MPTADNQNTPSGVSSPYLEQCQRLVADQGAAWDHQGNAEQRAPALTADLAHIIAQTQAMAHPLPDASDQPGVGQRLRQLKARFDLVAFALERMSLAAPQMAIAGAGYDGNENADADGDGINGQRQRPSPSNPLFESVGRHRSRFAAACIEVALAEAWVWAKEKSLLHRATAGEITGLFILGLGKLGGDDLNFSSDVDLVAFFDRDSFPVNPSAGRGEAAGKILARLGRTLSDPLLEGAGGRFVWRVDWRLRPDPSVNPLAISLGAALDYYFFHADPWERLAFAKARVIAGDKTAGDFFTSELEPFIWRRNLDFQALHDIADLKATIHARHPGLGSERERHWRDRGPLLGDWAGYNLKLGVGGIREIEFLTQAFQMLWGGRDQSLRPIHCPTALRALGAAKVLDQASVDSLLTAYQFLRRAENALQAFQNGQTQTLPTDAQTLAFIVSSAGYDADDDAGFLLALKQHTKAVSALFDALLSDRSPVSSRQGEGQGLATGLTTEPAPAPAPFTASEPIPASAARSDLETPVATLPPPRDLDEPATAMWRRLSDAKIPAARDPKGKRWLQDLLPWVSAVAAQAASPSGAVMRIGTFLARQPLSASYLETLVRYQSVRDSLARALVDAPSIGLLVDQSPHMIDRLIAGDPGDLRALFDGQLNSARDDEIWLERLRRIVNEELFATYSAVLAGHQCPQWGEARLTQLAQEAIRAQLRFVALNRKLDDARLLSDLNVIAMGKLGMNCMAPCSDLDLILVDALQGETRDLRAFMTRFITGMTTKMREGVAYELDLRLRPSGRSGPPAVSLAAFTNHHSKDAKTWEHLALSAGRTLNLGDNKSPGMAVEEVRIGALCRPRDPEQRRLDAARMLVRLREHRIKPGPQGDPGSEKRFDIKLRPGGLMETEYLCATLTLLAMGQGGHDDGRRLLAAEHDRRFGMLGLPDMEKALRFWRNAQWFARLLDLSAKTPPTASQTALFCQGMEVADLDAFDSLAAHHSQKVLAQVDGLLPEATLLADDPFWQDYREEPVRWVT